MGRYSLEFWEKVSSCDHKNRYDDYCVFVGCSHGDLGCSGGYESHCKDCKVYITEDPCGDMSGYSGWPYKKWKKHNKFWSGSVRWNI